MRHSIEADNLGSIIFFGLSGTVKTALSRIIASKTKARFEEANAVTVGIADIKSNNRSCEGESGSFG